MVWTCFGIWSWKNGNRPEKRPSEEERIHDKRTALSVQLKVLKRSKGKLYRIFQEKFRKIWTLLNLRNVNHASTVNSGRFNGTEISDEKFSKVGCFSLDQKCRLTFPWWMEQQLTEFREKENPNFRNFLPGISVPFDFSPGVFGWIVRFSDIQQFMGTFPGCILTIFPSFKSFSWMETVHRRIVIFVECWKLLCYSHLKITGK